MMEKIGPLIRKLREERGDPLRKVASFLEVDIAILSKMERGIRQVRRKHVQLLTEYFQLDKKTLLVSWLGTKILDDLEEEKYAVEALDMALHLLYKEKFKPSDQEVLIHQITSYLKKDGRVKRAWIYGDFVKEDRGIPDTIDIMLEEVNRNEFSYFDLNEIQNDLETSTGRKVNIAFTSTLSEYVAENLMKEAELIYSQNS